MEKIILINKLEKNIRNLLKEYNLKIIKDRSRMFIETDEIELVSKKLQKIYGILGIVICYKVDTKDIESSVIEILKNESFKTFKVITNRADKSFPINSMEYSKQIGALVLDNFDVKVDVHNPELYVNIEIRERATYIYTNELKGMGGYPVGIQGNGLLMLSGGIDSPVAGFLALKRGIDLECLYFESPPHTSIEAKNKVLKLALKLNDYFGNIKVHVVPFTEIQETIYEHCNPEYIITIMRRMMYRIAEKVCKKYNIKAIINGESVGQVASQTLSSMFVINNVTNMPIIRPVACLDKLEIIDIANKIDTYETSILPYEDCCTVFVPRHPVINPKLESCLKYEANFDYESLIEKAVENIEIVTKFRDDFKDIL